ncbi:MAG: ribosome silencing factor [Cyanobacteria bacterium P01_H01_bin.130]
MSLLFMVQIQSVSTNPNPNLDAPEEVTPIAPETPSPVDARTEAIAYAAADAMDDRKGEDIVLLKLSDVSYLADYFVIGTALSRAQVRAMSQSVRARLDEAFGIRPNNVSGEGDSAWVLQDYGDIIVHILMPDERAYYNLEAFWGHGETITFDPTSIPGRSVGNSANTSVENAIGNADPESA